MSSLLRRLQARVQPTTIGNVTHLPTSYVIDQADVAEVVEALKHHQRHACVECGRCVECEDGEPTRCGHGQVLCAEHWPGGCWHCQGEVDSA